MTIRFPDHHTAMQKLDLEVALMIQSANDSNDDVHLMDLATKIRRHLTKDIVCQNLACQMSPSLPRRESISHSEWLAKFNAESNGQPKARVRVAATMQRSA